MPSPIAMDFSQVAQDSIELGTAVLGSRGGGDLDRVIETSLGR